MGPGTQRTRLVEEMWEGVAAAGVTERFEATRRQMFDQVVAKFGASAVVSMERATDLAVFLGSDASGQLSGRYFEVVDDVLALTPRIPEIMASDVYTLRRVEPGRSATSPNAANHLQR